MAETQLRGMNARIQKLRAQSETTQPTISIERAVLLTQAYKLYEGTVEPAVLRGLAFKYIMQHRTLVINDGELIVGEKGTGPQSTPTFPELCCHTLEDFDVMDSRERISFKVDAETRKIQKEIIIPFWENRSMRKKMFDYLPETWKNAYEAGMFTEFMEQRAPGHTVADEKMYHKGYADFKKDIQKVIDSLDFNKDLLALERKAELEGMLHVCDGMIIFGERYAQVAREQAELATDPQHKADLLLIAANCDVVPKNKPETFHQAIQMYWLNHIAVTTEMNNWDAYSPGRLDQHLMPFYEADIKAGRLTRDQAKELLENLWVKFNNQPAPPKVGITLKESSTYTDFVNINTGGITADGRDGVNEVSYLILETMDEMRLLQPSSNVQISKKTPEKFLQEAAKISRKGWGQPAFYNTEALIQELMNAGKSIEDARKGGASGCVEVGVFGKEAYILTGYMNVPKILELTLNRGYDEYTQKQIGLDLGDPTQFKSYEEVFEAFTKQLTYITDIKTEGSNIIERLFAKHMPVPLLSILTDDCISSGVDYNAGGARYNVNYIQLVGIATITDSLVAIKKHVFEEENFTMATLLEALKADFKGYTDLHEALLHETPKYGNDDDYADSVLRETFDVLYETITDRPTVRGGKYRIEMLPTTCHIYFGQVMGASANGRVAYKALPDGISPEKGADTNGPTAVIKSASKIDQLKTGGALLNQKFSPSVLVGDTGLSSMTSLVRSYFTIDGHHIQFNVFDRETLIKAQQNPNDYNDLIVRVAGFSDYFNNLDKALQDEIIERTDQNF